MKLLRTQNAGRFSGSRATSGSGSAILVVLTVLALMSVLLIANGRVVWQLNGELRLLEKRQLQHWEKGAAKGAAPIKTGESPAR